MNYIPLDLFGPKVLPTSGGTALCYTCPANGRTVVKKIVFTNTDNALVHVTCYIVRSGGSISAATEVINFQPIAANSQYIAAELANQVLLPGDAIWATCDTASVCNATGGGWGIG